MKITSEQFESLLPLACEWAAQHESDIMVHGVPLSKGELADAARIPLQRPELVRVLEVNSIPSPDDPALAAAAQVAGLLTLQTTGLTLCHGIFVRRGWRSRRLVVHELVHTSQYERLGGIEPFLRCYLHECLTVGYPEAPMEQEAITTQQRICQQRPEPY